ncbi:hypothetical protein ACFL29_01140 [Patescibacteria group bacterium]
MKRRAFWISCFLIFLISGCGGETSEEAVPCLEPGEYPYIMTLQKNECSFGETPKTKLGFLFLSEGDSILNCGPHQILLHEEKVQSLQCTYRRNFLVTTDSDKITGFWRETYTCLQGHKGALLIDSKDNICINEYKFSTISAPEEKE